MKIDLHRMTVREVMEGYSDKGEEGVTAYGGALNIRPKYQREFVYKDKQRDAVIQTVKAGYPLNVMYWMKNDEGTFEVLDGQQRTISIGQYLNNDYSIGNFSFHNLTKTDQDQILNYELMIYHCEGTDKERLDWFRIINIAGEKLTDQELLNAVYTGPWLTDAKSKFSRTNSPAALVASERKEPLTGASPIRQELLEQAISWINNGNVAAYMSQHQHDPNANKLWMYFGNVILWVRLTFNVYRRDMKGVNWGNLYNGYHNTMIDAEKIEDEVGRLMQDEDVSRKSGIYEYVLTREEKYLNIRAFSEQMKREAYERQKGICPVCKKYFAFEGMEGDHSIPWVKGGRTSAANCEMLCRKDNREKSSN